MLAPNSESAALLFDALERAYRDAGREVWPTPQVRDFGRWQRERYEQRQLENASLARCLSEIEERELWRDVVAGSAVRPEALDPGTAARLARRARRTVVEYGIAWHALALQPSEETEAFLHWNQQFEERCRALGAVPSDALSSHLQAPTQRLFWIESPGWRPTVRAWLTRHAQCLAPASMVPEAVSLLHAASPAAELAGAADWARSRLAAHPEFRAWVCVPDLNTRRAEVVDAFDAALATRRFTLGGDAGDAPYAVAGGTPLADYAPVRIALECLEVGAARLSFARFSALLRSPYLQASDAEHSSAAALDVTLREHAPSEASLHTWLDLAESTARAPAVAPAALPRLRAVAATLANARGARRFSDWLPVWTAALQQGPWAFSGRWSSLEYQAVERLRELLAALAAADAFFGMQSREAALRVLRRAARDTAFQPQTGVPPIWVASQLTDPWLNFDGLWVGNLSATQWPAPVQTVALLPVRLQRAYGVVAASVETQLALATDLQARWLQRARECVFSDADDADGRAGTPSPLLPPDAVPLYRAAQAPPARPHWQQQMRAAPPLERFLDELAPPFAAPERTRGVASLRSQSLCAFRGFADTRLQCDALEQPTPGFDERERGELVHHALEHIWSMLRDSHALHALSGEAQHALLEEGANRALVAVCERRDPGPTWRRREKVRLHHLLGKWLDTERRRQPFTVEWLEHGAQMLSIAGVDFRVRIDRSDQLADGARVLIDYKTGAAGPDWRGERPDNPQLPIYALLSPQSLTAVAYGRVNAAESCFVCEAERPDIFRPGARATLLEGEPNMAALLQVWSVRIEALAADFARGHAAVAPTASACRYCQLQGLCRIPSTLDDEEAS